MAISPARSAAFDILTRVEREGSFASELLNAERYRGLSPADHGLTTEIVMGVLRWRSLLDAAVAKHSSQRLGKLDLEVVTALRLGVYQLLFLTRVPARAAVHESVELVKRARKSSAAPFANAVLRRIGEDASLRERARGGMSDVESKAGWGVDPAGTMPSPQDASQSARELASSYAHPEWLVARWISAYGYPRTRLICRQNQQAPQTAIRFRDAAVEDELGQEGVRLAPGILLASARRVVAGSVAQTRAFAQGRVRIQDEASQLVGLLTGRGFRLLDCCAAPGGKTAILAERNPESAIVAAEVHPHRARLLRERVPAGNVTVITADTRELAAGADFDRVLADVPCSGTGTLAHNPEIKWRLEAEDLGEFRALQKALLGAALSHVAPGGRLVYSTCSLEAEENQQMVEAALRENPSFGLLDCEKELRRLEAEGELQTRDWTMMVEGPFLRTLPGVVPAEGFFAALLERR